jgi:hypothetical protein
MMKALGREARKTININPWNGVAVIKLQCENNGTQSPFGLTKSSFPLYVGLYDRHSAELKLEGKPVEHDVNKITPFIYPLENGMDKVYVQGKGAIWSFKFSRIFRNKFCFIHLFHNSLEDSNCILLDTSQGGNP